MKGTVAVLVPTYNQPAALTRSLRSLSSWTRSAFRIYVIDNSVDKYAESIARQIDRDIVVLKTEKNLGWMGGINHGIKNSTENFVLFLNDDIKILDMDYLWLQKLMEGFMAYKKVGAVVPTSNMVMTPQRFDVETRGKYHLTPIVSGLCLLTMRETLEEVGLLDENLSGGDDLDFSWRLRKAGYNLLIRRDVFIYHYGSLTGKSINGSYWDSPDYTDRLNKDLIRKHGFKDFINMFEIDFSKLERTPRNDWEYEIMSKFCVGKGADIGCGDRKVVETAIGVDVTPKGERGVAGCQIGAKSEADIKVSDYILPFEDSSLDYIHNRHVLEHIIDDMGALREWVRVLKVGGHLIIAVPNEEVVDGIPLDPSHKHTYTLESLKNKLGYVCKYEVIQEIKYDISFVLVVKVSK